MRGGSGGHSGTLPFLPSETLHTILTLEKNITAAVSTINPQKVVDHN